MNYSKEKWIAGVVAILAVLFFFGGLFAYRSQQQNQDLLGNNALSEQNMNDTNSTSSDQKEGKTVTKSNGLGIQDVNVGRGVEASAGKSVTVNYTGMLEDGTVFDSSESHGQPFTFNLGAGQVIPGWEEGIVGMKVGGKRRLIIPPALAYGSQGTRSIPPNSTLIFDVQLVAVK